MFKKIWAWVVVIGILTGCLAIGVYIAIVALAIVKFAFSYLVS